MRNSNNKIMSESKLHHLSTAVPGKINRWGDLSLGVTRGAVMCEKIVQMCFKRGMKAIST